jgi:hypothetical protein
MLEFSPQGRNKQGIAGGDSQRARLPRGSRRPSLGVLEARLAPAVFVVETFADTVAVNLHAGQGARGPISLRPAIQASNVNPAPDTVMWSQGNYKPTIAGLGADFGSRGDLDIRTDVTI